MRTEERIETLMLLGLTLDQARTYLALLQAGPATIKEIAEISKIARPIIYRILVTLEEKGLIEKLVTKPASFQALPATYVIHALLKQKQTDQKTLEKRTQKLLDNIENIQSERHLEVPNDFAIVPKKEAIIQRIKQAILDAQISVFNITSDVRFSAAIVEFEDAYRQALQKGVKIRLATNLHVPSKKALRILKKLSLDPNFEVKYFEEPARVIATVLDNKEASVVLSATAHLPEASAIWSSNPCFVEIVQIYFESQWNKALHAEEATSVTSH